MILFYRQFFMLHSKKSILQVKIQRLRNNCRHVPFLKPFLRWNLKKNLKRVQDERWGLEFSHTQAQRASEGPHNVVGHETPLACTCAFSAGFGQFAPPKTSRCRFGQFWGPWGTFGMAKSFFGVIRPCMQNLSQMPHGAAGRYYFYAFIIYNIISH